jgi:outer membrane immunogenic protein
VNTAIIADVSPFFGVIAESNYARAANVLGTGRHVDVLSYLIGPTLYPAAHNRVRAYVQILVGGARVSGFISASDGSLDAFVNEFSWAVGGGVEYQLSRSVTIRSGGDYLYTHFFNPGEIIRGQNDLRLTTSVVLSVWQRPKRLEIE